MAGPLLDAAARVYEGQGWPATQMADGTGYTLDIEGTDGEWSAFALTDDAGATFVFYSLSPVDAPGPDLSRLAEFCHRANHGLVNATFELDHDTGEVRLRTGIELDTLPPVLLADADLLDAIVLDLSAANIGVFDHYLTGLVATTMSEVPVADIIRELEEPAPDE